MIIVTDVYGRQHALSPTAIARIAEAGTSSQWHGIRSVIRTFDGQVIECREDMADVLARLEAPARDGGEGMPQGDAI